ncbi:hypothetical protein B7Y94_02855 [Candidatus Saccharibacteria bacterium 32-49-12]|nr:MAG: hypothetical protein B7Y94_02855 [Candidatus Saccharibacteria bacterium 32-49-12]
MFKQAIIAISLMIFSSLTVSAVFSPSANAQTACDNDGKILTLKPWYYGLTNEDCSLKSPSDMSEGGENNGMQRFISRIVLTIVEDLLHIAGYVTVAFVIAGGFTYITSSGAPDKASRGMKTILNAVIGLVIAMASIALVNFIGGAMGL